MSLKHRLNRLEARFSTKVVSFPKVIFGETGRTHVDVIGASSNGNKVWRHPGETVEELIARSARELREKILFLVYADGHPGDTCVIFPK